MPVTSQACLRHATMILRTYSTVKFIFLIWHFLLETCNIFSLQKKRWLVRIYGEVKFNSLGHCGINLGNEGRKKPYGQDLALISLKKAASIHSRISVLLL